jgi:ABC-type amino acid transport substrate-binding protein
MAAVFFALGLLLARAIPYAYTGEETFVSMPLFGKPVSARQVEEFVPLPAQDRTRSRLAVIRERGALRVGYLPDRLPYAYRSSSGAVVGLDLDLVHSMARDLGVGIELTRLSWEDSIPALEDGRLDVVVGGIGVTPERAARVAFTRSYLEKSLGFAVRDHRRAEFSTLTSLTRKGGLRVLASGPRYYRELVQELLPNAEIITNVSSRAFFRGEAEDIDLMAVEAEGGAAWTLIYPDFTVIVPRGLRVKGSTSLALPTNQDDFSRYIDAWLEVSEKSAFIEQLKRYWILGQHDARKPPRWSIMRNVLGWGQTGGESAPEVN